MYPGPSLISQSYNYYMHNFFTNYHNYLGKFMDSTSIRLHKFILQWSYILGWYVSVPIDLSAFLPKLLLILDYASS